MTLARGLRLLCLIQQTLAPPATSISSDRLVAGIVSAPFHGQRQHQRCTTVTELDAVTVCNGPTAADRRYEVNDRCEEGFACCAQSMRPKRPAGWRGQPSFCNKKSRPSRVDLFDLYF